MKSSLQARPTKLNKICIEADMLFWARYYRAALGSVLLKPEPDLKWSLISGLKQSPNFDACLALFKK